MKEVVTFLDMMGPADCCEFQPGLAIMQLGVTGGMDVTLHDGWRTSIWVMAAYSSMAKGEAQ